MPFYYKDPLIKMPQTQELPDGDTWVLLSPIWYKRSNGDVIFVPPSGKGDMDSIVRNPFWTTDYGSIPMFAQNIFRKDGVYAPAYVVHDWIYTTEMFDRALCDMILCEMMQELGAWWLTRNIVYEAVRLGGGFTWDKHDLKVTSGLRDYAQQFDQSLPS